MAGNVVTKEMTEELIFSGADVIKAGPSSDPPPKNRCFEEVNS